MRKNPSAVFQSGLWCSFRWWQVDPTLHLRHDSHSEAISDRQIHLHFRGELHNWLNVCSPTQPKNPLVLFLPFGHYTGAASVLLLHHGWLLWFLIYAKAGVLSRWYHSIDRKAVLWGQLEVDLNLSLITFCVSLGSCYIVLRAPVSLFVKWERWCPLVRTLWGLNEKKAQGEVTSGKCSKL